MTIHFTNYLEERPTLLIRVLNEWKIIAGGNIIGGERGGKVHLESLEFGIRIQIIRGWCKKVIQQFYN